MHLTRGSLHAFRGRAQDVVVDVETTSVPGDFSDVEFEVEGVVTKSALVPTTGGDGILVAFTLTATDLTVDPGLYDYELRATVAAEVRTLAHGALTVSIEPTS